MLYDYTTCCNPPLSGKEVDAIWKSALKDNPTPSCPPEAVETCIRSWYWKNSIKPYQQRPTDDKGNSSETEIVTSDNPTSGDNSPPTQSDVSATVAAVTAILAKGLEPWLEQAELDALFKQTIMSHSSFWQMVATLKCKFDEVLPQDQQHLDQLIDWDNTHLDFHMVLPHMAADLLHDAKILNVDPVAIWQYILPAVLSFLGKQVNLNVDSHIIPAIIWTCLVMESGSGKTRAKKLVTSAIEKWQAAETLRFQKEYAEYKEKISTPKKEAPGEKIDPPRPERKYLFKIATVQALMRRLSEQRLYNSLLLRDEIGGWFKSLDQFSGKGETEGLDIFIEGWDGDDQQVDRVNHEDSFIVPQPRLSLTGGTQPGIFRKIFKDSEDSQGLQARMLFACLKVRPAKRVKGYCHLSDLLPKLFKWIEEQFPKTTLKLSPSAEVLYDKIYESIGTQAEKAPTPAIRVWMRKLSSQILRIAMALHAIECFYEPNRPRHEIQRDTLERAIEIGRYYRSAFQVVQEKTADSDSISSILLKIWDLGIANPTGIIARDAYRSIKAIGRRAKELGRQVGAYTVELFTQLQQMGRGRVEKDGRQFRFVVTLSEPPSDGGGNNGNNGGSNHPISPTPPDNSPGVEETIGNQEPFADTAVHESEQNSAGSFCPVLEVPPSSEVTLSPASKASNNENEAIGETVTAVTVSQPSIDQALQLSPNEPLSQVTTENCSAEEAEEARGSDELTWLMSFLTDLESQPQPHDRFTSQEQLIELFLEAEQKSECCQDELNQCCPDYWERKSRMLGEIIQVLPEAKPTEPSLLNSSVTFVLELVQQCCNILDVERIAYQQVKANISDDAFQVAFNQLDETTRCRIEGLLRQLKKHLATLRNGLSVQALDGFYGTICAKSKEPTYQQWLSYAKQPGVRCVDETTYCIDGIKYWLWVATSDRVCVLVLAPTRSSAELSQLLGENFSGILCSDCFSAYNPQSAKLKQKCLTHLERDLEALLSSRFAGNREFAVAVSQILGLARSVYRDYHAGKLSRDAICASQQRFAIASSRTDLESQLQAVLDKPIVGRWPSDAQRLANRIKRHWDEWFTDFRYPEVKPDNNDAERALRPIVVQRTGSVA
jgi:hypothetical protein